MIVITTLLTAAVDPQRGRRWCADGALVADLADSVHRHGHTLTVLHDTAVMFPHEGARWVRVDAAPDANPYHRRWHVIFEYLTRSHGATESVWCVDGTDVEMLRDPALDMEPDTVYVGSEPDVVGCEWMRALHPSSAEFIDRYHDLPLFNAGILGGTVRDVTAFTMAVAFRCQTGDTTDMAAFNEVAYTFPDRVVTGPRVHTEFRAEQTTHPTAWWRHK